NSRSVRPLSSPPFYPSSRLLTFRRRKRNHVLQSASSRARECARTPAQLLRGSGEASSTGVRDSRASNPLGSKVSRLPDRSCGVSSCRPRRGSMWLLSATLQGMLANNKRRESARQRFILRGRACEKKLVCADDVNISMQIRPKLLMIYLIPFALQNKSSPIEAFSPFL